LKIASSRVRSLSENLQRHRVRTQINARVFYLVSNVIEVGIGQVDFTRVARKLDKCCERKLRVTKKWTYPSLLWRWAFALKDSRIVSLKVQEAIDHQTTTWWSLICARLDAPVIYTEAHWQSRLL